MKQTFELPGIEIVKYHTKLLMTIEEISMSNVTS